MPNDRSRNRPPASFNGNGNGESIGCGTIIVVSASIFAAYLLGMASAYVCFCMR